MVIQISGFNVLNKRKYDKKSPGDPIKFDRYSGIYENNIYYIL
jgi:hypothetical protein